MIIIYNAMILLKKNVYNRERVDVESGKKSVFRKKKKNKKERYCTVHGMLQELHYYHYYTLRRPIRARLPFRHTRT